MRKAGRIAFVLAVLLAPLAVYSQAVRWPAGGLLSDLQLDMLGGADGFFWEEEINDDVFERIDGVSYPRGCTVPRSDLRLLHLLHRNFGGHIQIGEMICAASVASEVLAIFRELYDAGYPIEKILLIDEYGASDEKSMADNNTSCFNFRPMTGGRRLSLHAYGRAVDINPLYNPYVKGGRVEPAAAARYTDRSLSCKYYIRRGDICHRAFTRRGWKWGGSWLSASDYQHFEKAE
jgi:hypothetical protein